MLLVWNVRNNVTGVSATLLSVIVIIMVVAIVIYVVKTYLEQWKIKYLF